MPNLETEHVFEGSPERVFQGIKRYGDYPQYIPGVKSIEVLPPTKEGSCCRVRYEINLVKKFHYTLHMFEDSPSRVWWSLDESNVMKKNEGHWELKSCSGGKTQADYCLDVTFRGLVPKALTNKVAQTSLPGLFEGMQLLIDTPLS